MQTLNRLETEFTKQSEITALQPGLPNFYISYISALRSNWNVSLMQPAAELSLALRPLHVALQLRYGFPIKRSKDYASCATPPLIWTYDSTETFAMRDESVIASILVISNWFDGVVNIGSERAVSSLYGVRILSVAEKACQDLAQPERLDKLSREQYLSIIKNGLELLKYSQKHASFLKNHVLVQSNINTYPVLTGFSPTNWTFGRTNGITLLFKSVAQRRPELASAELGFIALNLNSAVQEDLNELLAFKTSLLTDNDTAVIRSIRLAYEQMKQLRGASIAKYSGHPQTASKELKDTEIACLMPELYMLSHTSVGANSDYKHILKQLALRSKLIEQLFSILHKACENGFSDEKMLAIQKSIGDVQKLFYSRFPI